MCSASITAANRTELAQQCAIIRSTDPGVKLWVVGHADAAGSDRFNLRLSQRRADSVVEFMIDECGVSVERFRSVGRGEMDLLPNVPPVSQANRRVEFRWLAG